MSIENGFIIIVWMDFVLFCFLEVAFETFFCVCFSLSPLNVIESNIHTYRHTWQPNKTEKNDNLVMMIIHTSFDRWSFFMMMIMIMFMVYDAFFYLFPNLIYTHSRSVYNQMITNFCVFFACFVKQDLF